MKKINSICLSIILLIGLTGCMTHAEGRQYQKGMTEYLNNKYGMEFVVGEVSQTGNEAFGYHTYYAMAHSKDNPEIEFTVTLAGKYSDGYLWKKWSNEGEPEAAKIIKKVYNEDLLHRLSFYIYRTEEQKLLPEEYNLTYSQVVKKYPDKTRTELFYVVFSDTDIDKTKESEKVMKVYNLMFMENEIKDYLIYVYFVPKSNKTEFIKLFKQEQINSKKLHEMHLLFNVLYLDRITNPSTPAFYY